MPPSTPRPPATKRKPVARPRRRIQRVVAHPARRLALCGLLVIVIFGALAVRVTQLQVLSGDRYRLASLSQTKHYVSIPAQRGTIFDRDGRDLAMSVDLSAVYADPQRVLDPIAYAAQLAPILHVSDTDLRELMSNRKREFQFLAHRVDDTVVAEVRKLGLAGIGFSDESARQYPSGALAGSVIGEVGGDGAGLTGLEWLYRNELKGRAGKLVVERDQQGLDIPNTASHEIDAERGTDIVLTLDEPLQWETEQSLIDEVNATQAKGGMAVVVDTANGDVLAMASIEGASGNSPTHVSGPTEATRPLQQLFEPGSTNKLITLSTAIEDGLVTPDTVIDVPSALMIGGARFSDVDVHGDVKMTVSEILRQSSNIGTIEIAQRLTNDRLADALKAFGLGSTTSIDFPGQASGILRDPDHYYSNGLASTAIGYGVAVTGMQMLDAYVTIANGGVTRPPRLLDATVDAKGVRHDAAIVDGHRVVSSQTAAEMSQMLTGVVSGGTGACAAIQGYTIAGKTGTAHKATNGGYSTGTMASFIGYAPAAHPKLASIVVLDEPATTYGGAAAAPVFADVMQFALTHYGVTPDDVTNAQFDAARSSAAEAGTECIDPAAAAAAHAATEQATAIAQHSASTTTVPHKAAKHGPASTTSTTPATTPGSGAGATKTSSPTGTGGAPATAGSVSGDTSQSG
jgi:cell division protein FtsI (penicillin-binding protein 3)